MKPVKGLVVREWKPDVVYLIQFPRTHIVPSPSPFSLKLETWLRMNGLKYQNVSNEFKKASAKGQIPFVELNGRQFSDSNQIIEHLRSHFKLAMDGKLNSLERANARAYTILIEESLFRCMLYDRSQDMSWVATDRGWLQHMKGVPKLLFQKLGVKQFQSQIKKVLMAQGYGRHSQAEIEEITGKDLMALSTLLGEKSFLFGEHPTTLDATLFGHLVQLTDCPLHSKAIKPLLEKSAPNLLGFVQRVKRRYWPDWQEICDHLAMNPEDVEANKAAAAATVVVTHPPTHHQQQQQQHHQQAQKAH